MNIESGDLVHVQYPSCLICGDPNLLKIVVNGGMLSANTMIVVNVESAVIVMTFSKYRRLIIVVISLLPLIIVVIFAFHMTIVVTDYSGVFCGDSKVDSDDRGV